MPGMDGFGIRSRLDEARLYLCTDARREHGDLAEFVDAAKLPDEIETSRQIQERIKAYYDAKKSK